MGCGRAMPAKLSNSGDVPVCLLVIQLERRRSDALVASYILCGARNCRQVLLCHSRTAWSARQAFHDIRCVSILRVLKDRSVKSLMWIQSVGPQLSAKRVGRLWLSLGTQRTTTRPSKRTPTTH